MLKKILRKLSEYPRLRVLVVLGIVLVVIIILFELFTPRTNTFQAPSVPASQIQGQNLAQGSHPTQIGTAQRIQEAKQLKTTTIENKAKSGADIFMPGLFDTSSNSAATNKSSDNKNIAARSPEEVLNGSSAAVPVISPANLAKAIDNSTNPTSNNSGSNGAYRPYGSYGQYNNQAMTLQEQQKAEQQAQLESQMRASIGTYSGQWTTPVQTRVGNPDASANGLSNGGAGFKMPAQTMIKAGTILFAVLENALNSDQAGTPVLAQIAAGKYQGAELMGSFSTSADNKLIIKFDRMILKNYPDSISINAYAIDPTTAQNALASYVDNHYVERYSSLFAAAMLQGFGNAYSNYQNPCYGTNNCFIDGNVQKTDVTTKTAMYQGLGQIGTNVASQVQNNFNRPATIVLNQGSGMGILFMDNVANQAAGSGSGSGSGSAGSPVSANAMLGNPAALSAFGNTSAAGMSVNK